MKIFILILIAAGLANVIVFDQKDGVFSVPENAKKIKIATRIGLLVLLGTAVCEAVTAFFYEPLLNGLGLMKLKAVVYLLAALGVGHLYAAYLKAKVPAVYTDFAGYLPLVTADIGIVGIALFTVQKDFLIGRSLGAGISAGLLFGLILSAMTAAQKKMNGGVPKLVLYALLTAVAFWGLNGLPL